MGGAGQRGARLSCWSLGMGAFDQRVDLVGELLDERVEASAEGAVVAPGRRAFEVAPAGVDVVDVVTAGSWGLRVWTDGGVDMVAAGGLGPGPGVGEAAFAAAPICVGHEAVLDHLRGQARDELAPLVWG